MYWVTETLSILEVFQLKLSFILKYLFLTLFLFVFSYGPLGDSLQEMPIFWIFPYFFEARICQFFPSFCMLDYQV